MMLWRAEAQGKETPALQHCTWLRWKAPAEESPNHYGRCYLHTVAASETGGCGGALGNGLLFDWWTMLAL